MFDKFEIANDSAVIICRQVSSANVLLDTEECYSYTEVVGSECRTFDNDVARPNYHHVDTAVVLIERNTAKKGTHYV